MAEASYSRSSIFHLLEARKGQMLLKIYRSTGGKEEKGKRQQQPLKRQQSESGESAHKIY